MKKIIFWIFCLHLFANFSVAQPSSESNCALINNGRDSLFIEFEKAEEKPTGKGKKERNIVLRLRNNSTCAIEVISSDIEHFLVKSPSTEIQRQRLDQKIRTELTDGELVPAFNFYTEFAFYENLFVTKNNNGGDYKVALSLKGGNSLLFSVPFENFKKKMLVLIPFMFQWETEMGNTKYSGDTHHLVWFSYGNLPDEIKQKLKIK